MASLLLSGGPLNGDHAVLESQDGPVRSLVHCHIQIKEPCLHCVYGAEVGGTLTVVGVLYSIRIKAITR